MIIDINHFSFTVENLDKSIEFYRDFLGLELINKCERGQEFSSKVTGVKNAHLKIAYLKALNCCIELIEYISPPAQKLDTEICNVGSSHICFNVENFDSWIKKMKKFNVKISGEVCIIPAGPNKGKQVVYFEDNDNNTLEFISDKIAK